MIYVYAYLLLGIIFYFLSIKSFQKEMEEASKEMTGIQEDIVRWVQKYLGAIILIIGWPYWLICWIQELASKKDNK